MEQVRARVGQETRLPEGWRVVVTSLSEVKINPNPSAVSLHEARHTFAAMLLGIGVHYMTNIPEGDSAGHTLLSGFHPVVAAAPHALGSPGGGDDLRKIKDSGHSVNGSIARAQNLLAGYEKEILALATALDKKKKLGGTEMYAIAREVTDEKEKGKVVLIRFISPDGKEKTLKKRAANENVYLAPTDLPKAA